MVNKILIIIFLLFIFEFGVYAKEDEVNKPAPAWGENSSVFNKGFENQKPVSDSKLKKTIEQLKERNLSRKQRKIQNEVNPLSPSIDMDHLKSFTQSQGPDDDLNQTLTVMIPVRAYSEDGIYISPGYYKLSCHKVAKNEYILELSQGTRKILNVKAQHTAQDLEQETITFCNAEIIDKNRIRLVYGSIDLNLVGYLYFK